MPKRTAHPRLRLHVRKGKNGQVWPSWWFDRRSEGLPDLPLGNDYAEALKKWDELANRKPRIAGTIQEAIEAWRAEKLDSLETRYDNEETRKGYRRQLAKIEPIFGPATWDQIELKQLKAYLKARSAKTQGNRELAVLSLVWRYAQGEGFTKLPFPAAGLEKSRWKNKEKPNTFEVTDAIFEAIYKHAEPHLRDAMDLATATGMRVMDVVKLQITDHRGDVLLMRANKTDKPAEFDLTKSAILPALIERRKAHKALHFGMLTKDSGAKVTLRMLQGAFNRARAEAVKECPEAAGANLRFMRKRASKLAGSTAAARKLLQHSSEAVTERHYPVNEKLRPVR